MCAEDPEAEPEEPEMEAEDPDMEAEEPDAEPETWERARTLCMTSGLFKNS